MKKILLLFSLFALIGCKTTKKSNSELYVSGYTSEDFNVPSEVFLGFKNDSVYLINKDNNASLGFKTPKSKTDTVTFDNNKLIIQKSKSNAKFEHYKDNKLAFQAFFFNVKEERNIDSLEFIKKVNHKTFQSKIEKTPSSPNSDLKILKQLKFNNNEITVRFDYYFDESLMYSEFETHKYEIKKIKKSLFLQILKSDNFSNRIYEIVKLKNNEFTLVHYAETKTIYEDFKKVEPSIIKSKPYQICNDRRPYEYFSYDPDLRHQKGNKYLLKTLGKDAPLTKGNGYINIHFIINCNYEIGRFGLEQMDMNYNAATFDTALIKHLITKISEIKDWNSNKEKNNGNDIHYFLMFKIENGKIIDLCP